ncbi:MAG: hypothetical protein QXO67_04360, partial [Candidatus Bathyarchaeia archaeon]
RVGKASETMIVKARKMALALMMGGLILCSSAIYALTNALVPRFLVFVIDIFAFVYALDIILEN